MTVLKLTALVMGMWLIGYLMGRYERRDGEDRTH